MEKGGIRVISHFSPIFVLIYWTCLIGFGGKFHRSCNLAHSVRDLDWLVVLWFNATLTLSQTGPGFLRVCSTSLLKTLWEKEKLLVIQSTPLDNFLPFSSNLELSSANSFSLEGSKICRLGKV